MTNKQHYINIILETGFQSLIVYTLGETIGEEPTLSAFGVVACKQTLKCLFLYVSRETLKREIMKDLKKEIKLMLKVRKHCKHICLFCKYYYICYDDIINKERK